MAASSPARKRPAKRSSHSAAASSRHPLRLRQVHLDLLGLALAGLAIFLAFIIHLNWDGGAAGSTLVTALKWAVGAIHVLTPVALMSAAALLALGPMLPTVRPFRAGAVCLLLALTLAFAAGTFGLGPDGARPAGWEREWVQDRGGMLGEALYRGVSALFSSLGAHILALCLLLAGVLLLTGATVAGFLQATGRSVSRTQRKLRDSTAEVRAGVARRRGTGQELGDIERDAQLRVRALRGRSERTDKHEDAQWSGPDSFRELFDDEDDVATKVPGDGNADRGKPPSASSSAEPTSATLPFPFPASFDSEDDEPANDGGEVDAQADEDDSAEGFAGPGARSRYGDDAPEAAEPEAHEAQDQALGDGNPGGGDPRYGDPGGDDAGEPRLAEDPVTDEPGVMRGAATRPNPADLTPQGRYRASVTEDPSFAWGLPDPRRLKRSSIEAGRPDRGAQEKIAAQLIEALGHFGIAAEIVGMVSGPHITRYELRLAPGIKVGKVAQLKDDLSYALAASDIRILAPIPGKQAVGVEVPNKNRRIVHLGDVLQAPPEGWSPLTVWLGKDVAGRAIAADLAKMPHLLVAGTTGAGKSGCVNAMLSSILLRATPHEVRMVLVDPKQVELTHYDSIPHLLTPVITSPRKAANALQNLVREMERRYGMMSLARTRTLPELNRVRAGRGEPALPYVLCVIDELADLMMVAPDNVEDAIIRLAQKARAVGIHLVLATQSPRVDVITGMIKANVPSRIAFAVSSQTDSRVILDQNGAETLLGQGDMLFAPVGSSRLQRIQGAYIDEEDIAGLTEAWRRQGEPEFREELLEEVEESQAEETSNGEFDPDEDSLLPDAIRLVAEMQTASTSMLQRRLRLGYTRAGRLIDMLERRGVISGYEGSKPRQVMVTEADLPRVLAALSGRDGVADEPPAEVAAALEES